MAVIFNVADFIYTIMRIVFGGQGSWFTVIFVYIAPAFLVYVTLVDFFGLFPFRQTTRHVLAIVFALIGSHIGLYSQFLESFKAIFDPFIGRYSLALSLFTVFFIYAIVSFAMHNIIVSFNMTRNAMQNIDRMKGGKEFLSAVGNKAAVLGEKKQE